MEQYIDKSALVAEIERRIKEYQSTDDDYWFPVIENLKNILSFLDTLEVKGVDLDKEFDSFLNDIEGMPPMWHSEEQIEWGKDIARHFFELGLKAQKKE